ncbi:enoyl-CoA hydratase/isomerase family protein [Polymorphum gilvum]|uniref:Enoyl-CoA hydratase/isomerase family protein n=1 Tax=Polymorphum gilvum (strain LMG 25793 / CGMCC 1.9160 / SL003B-26A1) TaxID=991905 RepID=F2J127_POLGS|nr:enoyl-CoA hydratase/isomerase family protein [Polymorphum gilvum]ADZ71973.1 Enoyl-CoA hydratase/isomerase family protein [Polymorphum gilvum SL003B-26A1]
MTAPVELALRDGIATLTLARTDRHNALVPELVDALRARLAEAVATEPVALVLASAARSFSTGGDIAGFLAHAGTAEELLAYSRRLVSGLHAAILELLRFPAPVVAAVNGPLTGGSLGLVLAADLVAMSRSAFLQPYYVEMGFAPDGGWTALLPERVGVSAALAIQLLNRRIDADEAHALGLATQVVEPDGLGSAVDAWMAALRTKDRRALAATRSGVWDAPRLALVAARLDRERDRFLDLVGHPDTVARMRRFSGGR